MVVRALVVAPANVQAHAVARNALECDVERFHVQRGLGDVLGIGLALEHHVPTEPQVG